jgi:hypothetical protein
MKPYLPLAVLIVAATLALPRVRSAQTTSQHPGSRRPASSAPAPPATATPVFVQPGELAPPPGSPTPKPEHTAHPAATAEQAIRDYVALAGNWTATTIVAHYRRLAASTVGDARLHAQAMVARVAIDRTYQSRTPRLETELAGVVRRGGNENTPTYLVVIRQRLTLKGGPAPSPTPAWQIAIAALTRDQQGWVLTRWTEPRA